MLSVVFAVQRLEKQEDEIHPFRTYQDPAFANQKRVGLYNHDPKQVYIHEAARATTAAPTYFKEASFYGNRFMDGGVMVNNPSLKAWEEAEYMLPHREDPYRSNQTGDRIGLLVSVGTGVKAPQSIFSKGNPWRKFRKIIRKATGDMTNCEKAHGDCETSARRQRLPYYRFNSNGLEKMKMDECKSRGRTFEAIRAAANNYLGSADTIRAMNECAISLVQKRRERCGDLVLQQNHNLTRPGPRR
jgi:hypothetical protein